MVESKAIGQQIKPPELTPESIDALIDGQIVWQNGNLLIAGIGEKGYSVAVYFPSGFQAVARASFDYSHPFSQGDGAFDIPEIDVHRSSLIKAYEAAYLKRGSLGEPKELVLYQSYDGPAV